MLVLTRKNGESTLIGDPNFPEGTPVEIVVAQVQGDSVRIGISAPVDVVVDRKEIWEEKHEQAV